MFDLSEVIPTGINDLLLQTFDPDFIGTGSPLMSFLILMRLHWAYASRVRGPKVVTTSGGATEAPDPPPDGTGAGHAIMNRHVSIFGD
jgi:hypothetical protein